MSFHLQMKNGIVESLLWLANFSEEKRTAILNELYHYLQNTFDQSTYTINHGFHVAMLKLVEK